MTCVLADNRHITSSGDDRSFHNNSLSALHLGLSLTKANAVDSPVQFDGAENLWQLAKTRVQR